MPIKNNNNDTLSKAPKEKYIEEDLKKYTKGQLLELRDRQKKLLANKSWLAKLPDKGERIQKLHDRIVEEIGSRNEIDQAAQLFSELNIVEKGVKAVTHMEWNGGKMDGDQVIVAADTLDSDDDEDPNIDPLKIIAQSRETKLVKIEKPPESLITKADLEDIKSMTSDNANSVNNSSLNTSSTSVELDPHAVYIMKKDESMTEKTKSKTRFLPFRTTKSDVHNIEREKKRSHGPHWEVTAATPPILRNNAVQMVSLQESIEIERQHKEKLREQMEKQAEERLAARKQIIAENISLLPPGSALQDPNAFFQSYRQREEKYNELEESDNDTFSENSYNGEEADTHGISVVICDR